MSLEPKGRDRSFRMNLNSGKLRNAKKKLRTVVEKDYGGDIELISELHSYFWICAEIFVFISRPVLRNLLRGEQLRKEVLKFRPSSLLKAEPILWQGELPKGDGDSRFDGISFSFKEVDRWTATYKFVSRFAYNFSGVFSDNSDEEDQ